MNPQDRDLRGAWCGENRWRQDQSQLSKISNVEILPSRFSPGSLVDSGGVELVQSKRSTI
jgi:hypothetical protein